MNIYNNFRNITRRFSINSLAYSLNRNLSTGFVFDGEYHDFLELLFVESGKVEVVEEENIYLMEAGDIIFHAPMEFHKVKTTDNTTAHIYNISMMISGDPPENIYCGTFKLSNIQENRFTDIFNKVSAFWKSEINSPYDGQAISAELEALIIDICRSSISNNKPLEDVSARTYKRIIETMHREVYNNVSLSYISSLNHISISYLKNLFSRYCDYSPKEYYQKLRLREAVKMLAENTNIYMVADKLGFSSPNHFTDFFKRQAGITPSHYKMKIKGNK